MVAQPVAVVTGASRGLGAALAAELLGRRYLVAACATTRPNLHARLCRSVDVSDHSAVEHFAWEVANELGPIDLWINAAAITGPVGLLGEVSPTEWSRCIEVNVLGTLHGCQAFFTHRSSKGVLVNIASRAGVKGVAGLAAYSATKAAIIALTQSVAEENGGSGVFVVIPPSVDTDMQRGLLAHDEGIFPGVVESRARRDSGGILIATDAAIAILRSVLDDAPTSPMIDLSDLSA